MLKPVSCQVDISLILTLLLTLFFSGIEVFIQVTVQILILMLFKTETPTTGMTRNLVDMPSGALANVISIK